MIRLLSLLKLPCSVPISLAAAAWLTAGAGPALAQGAVNGNPGGNNVVSVSAHGQLSCLPPSTVNLQTNAYATEIIGRLASGAPLFDVTVPDAFGSAGVQAALASDQTALLAAGGPGTTIAMLALLSSVSTSSSISSTTYSLDPSFDPDRSVVVSTTQTFGPASVNAYAAGQSSTAVNPGFYSQCFTGNPADFTATLPSVMKPNCPSVDGGTLSVLPGQLDINVDRLLVYPIDTTTTVTSTTTLAQAYQLVATLTAASTVVPEPPGWIMLASSLTVLGLTSRRPGCL